jgi:hypothetical protein
MSQTELLNVCLDWIVQHGLAQHPAKLENTFREIIHDFRKTHGCSLCKRTATISCGKCQTRRYCGQDCRNRDCVQNKHHITCNSGTTEGLTSALFTRSIPLSLIIEEMDVDDNLSENSSDDEDEEEEGDENAEEEDGEISDTDDSFVTFIDVMKGAENNEKIQNEDNGEFVFEYEWIEEEEKDDLDEGEDLLSLDSIENEVEYYDDSVAMEDSDGYFSVDITNLLKKRQREDNGVADKALVNTISSPTKKQRVSLEEESHLDSDLNPHIFQIIHDVLLQFVADVPEFLLAVVLLLKLSKELRRSINASTIKRYRIQLPLEYPRLIISGVMKSRNAHLLQYFSFLLKFQSDLLYQKPFIADDNTTRLSRLLGYEGHGGDDFEDAAKRIIAFENVHLDQASMVDGHLARLLDDHQWKEFTRVVVSLDLEVRQKLFKTKMTEHEFYYRWAQGSPLSYTHRLMLIQSVLRAIVRNDLKYIRWLFSFVFKYDLGNVKGVKETFYPTGLDWLTVSLGEMILLSPSNDMFQLILSFDEKLPRRSSNDTWNIYKNQNELVYVMYMDLNLRIGDFFQARALLRNPLLLQHLETLRNVKKITDDPLKYGFNSGETYGLIALESPSYAVFSRIWQLFQSTTNNQKPLVKQGAIACFVQNPHFTALDLDKAFQDGIFQVNAIRYMGPWFTTLLNEFFDITLKIPGPALLVLKNTLDVFCFLRSVEQVNILFKQGLRPFTTPQLTAYFLFALHKGRYSQSVGLLIAQRLDEWENRGVAKDYKTFLEADQAGTLPAAESKLWKTLL